uniref:SXP/RAL-2 family protein Ani s 5-like cation-binding domain-containing protein n=1 Tax=Panagrolaimus sp. ES5 TaxID=591445 RepID=A0AC34FB42_9BILA
MFVVKILPVFVVLLGISCFANAQGFGSGEGGRGGGGGGGGFMRAFGEISQELTPQQRQQVKTIFMDPSTPKYITKQKLQAFFQRIGGNAASKYFEFQEKMQARKAMMHSMFERRQSMMDPGMRQIMQQIRQIHQNDRISFAQERAQIKQVMASAPPEVRAKFQEMRERFRGGGMMGMRGGGFGGGGGQQGMMMGAGNNNGGGGMFGVGNGGQGFGPFGGRFQGFQGQPGGFNRF